MIEIFRERRVAADPAAVWAVVAAPERAAEWFAFADRVEVLDGDGVGQHQRQHGTWGRRRAEIDREITEYDAPHRYGWRHVAERLDGMEQLAAAAEAVAGKKEGGAWHTTAG